MTKLERLLALEAALIACEGYVPTEKVRDLQKWLDAFIESNYGEGEYFGQFLEAQKAAVQKLVENPQVFGG